MTGPRLDPDTWVSEHGDALYRYALARINFSAGAAEAAEEIVQETLLAALQAQHTFRGDAAVRTWLIGILRHKLVDFQRRLCRDQTPTTDGDADDAIDRLFTASGGWRMTPGRWQADPAQLSEDREFWAVFSRCREALPTRQAALFTQRVLDDADPEILCKEFALSPTNLWVLLHRARMRLRACLEKHWFTTRRA